MRLFNPYYPNQAKIDIECRKTKKYFAFLCHDCFFYPTSDKKRSRLNICFIRLRP